MAQNSNVCRLCLSVNVLMVPVVGTPVQRVYENLMKAALPASATCPTMACYICHAELVKCHLLMLRVFRAHKVLDTLLKKFPEVATNLAALLGDKANSLRASLCISPVDNIDSTSLQAPVVLVYKTEQCLVKRLDCPQSEPSVEGNSVDDNPSTSYGAQLQDLDIKVKEEPWEDCPQLPTAADEDCGLFGQLPSSSLGVQLQESKVAIKEEPWEGSPHPPIYDDGDGGAFVNDVPSTNHYDELQDLKIEIKEEPWGAPSSPELHVMPPVKVYTASKRHILVHTDRKRRRPLDDSKMCKKLRELIQDKNKNLRRERRRNIAIKKKIKSKQIIDINRIQNETSRMLTRMQSKGNNLQWTEEEKKFCLSLFSKYPGAYKHLRKAGVVLAGLSTIESWLKPKKRQQNISEKVIDDISIEKNHQQNIIEKDFDDVSIENNRHQSISEKVIENVWIKSEPEELRDVQPTSP